MHITWKDGVTTLAAAGAVLLERAHFHDLGVPLVADVRWALLGIGILAAITFIFGFLMDESHDTVWSAIASVLGAVILGTILLGLVIASSDFVVVLMLSTAVFWFISILSHMRSTTRITHGQV